MNTVFWQADRCSAVIVAVDKGFGAAFAELKRTKMVVHPLNM